VGTDKYHIQVSHHLRVGKNALNEYDQYAVYLAILNHGAPQKGFISAGQSHLMGSVYGDESVSHRELLTVVIPRMRIDRVTKAATSDPIIMRVGAVLLHKLGPRRALDISSSMRKPTKHQSRKLPKHQNPSPVHLAPTEGRKPTRPLLPGQ